MTFRVLLFALLCCLAINAASSYETEVDTHITDLARLLDPSLAAVMTRQSRNVARDGACIQTSCKKHGESCLGGGNSTECAYGLVCHNNKCQYTNQGARCKHSDDCYGWETPVCINDVCSYYSYPGDACLSSAECAFGLPCMGGTCQGKALGATCNATVTRQQCVFGAYCNRNTSSCTASLAVGSPCSGNGRCEFPSFCVSGTCTLLFSQPAASPCRDFFVASVCNTGLYCLNKTCQAPPTQPFPIQGCAGCPSGVCECMPFVGQQFCYTPFYAPAGSDCNYAIQGAAQCLAYNKCSLSSSPKRGACAIDNCGGYLVQGINCLCPSIQKIAGDCYSIPVGKCATRSLSDVEEGDDGSDDDGDKAGLALGLLLGFVTLIVLIVSFIVLFIKHRQSSYQTISL